MAPNMIYSSSNERSIQAYRQELGGKMYRVILAPSQVKDNKGSQEMLGFFLQEDLVFQEEHVIKTMLGEKYLSIFLIK